MSTASGDYTTLVPVTGEAVALDLRLAQFPSRTLALVLDLTLQLLVLLALVWLGSAVAGALDAAAGSAIMLVAVVAVIVGMPTLIETLTRGRSVGKIAAGLRVVRDDGGPVRFRHSFVRALFMIVDFWISSGSVGLISSLLSTRGKRLGDHFAGTVVIRQRVPAAASLDRRMVPVPPALAPWAASLDLARLPDVTAMQARQLLARAETLEPGVRDTLARQLAAEVASYVAPPPPVGLPDSAYLQVVLAERLRRAQSEAPRARAVAVMTAVPSVPPAPPVTSGTTRPGPVPDGGFRPPG